MDENMQEAPGTTGSQDHGHTPGHHPGKRNRYFKNKYITASDFRLEQEYGIARRRLLSRAALGWGVVAGLDLESATPVPLPTPSPGPVPASALLCRSGLALDRHGRELYLPGDITLAGSDCLLLGGFFELAQRLKAGMEAPPAQGLPALLQIHYAERGTDRVRTSESCNCGENEFGHVQETVVFSLQPLPQGCPDNESPCQGCQCHFGAGQPGPDGSPPPPDGSASPHDRGPHACLCEWVAARALPHDEADLCNWNGTLVAKNDGVALACVTLFFDACGHARIGPVTDQCRVRRLVKNNDLLHDLIRGCDLTRIDQTSWFKWHRSKDSMSWSDFAAFFPEPPELQERGRQDEQSGDPAVPTRFAFGFSAPVRVVTLQRDAVAITFYVPDDRSGWLGPVRMPITRLIPDAPLPGDPEGSTRRVTVEVSRAWARDEIWTRTALIRPARSRAEIEVRGDFIIDCKGQALDANAVGLRPAPSGNGSPGGTYLSTFYISPNPATDTLDN